MDMMKRMMWCSNALLLLLLLFVTCGEATIRVETGEADPDSPATLISRLNPHGRPIRIDLDDKYLSRDACSLPPTFPVGQQVMVTIGTGDGDRHFALYIPTSYKPTKDDEDDDEDKEDDSDSTDTKTGVGETLTAYPAMPLHVLFHGLNDECASFMNHTEFLAKAEAEGYIVASACGLRGLLGIAWNAGTCCGFFNADKPDDFGFARRVVKAIAHGVCIDATRVMATGFSNGGMLAEVLGCVAADVFGAVASVGGVVELRPGNEAGLRACDAALNETDNNNNTGAVRRAGVLLVHGDGDIKVPWNGNHYLGFPPVMDDFASWATRNGCPDTPQSTINTTNFENTFYDQCSVSGKTERNVIVELVRARGGGHHWFESDEFSTGGHIREFAKRVFGDST